jgi:ribonuclease BN (tRNA processing enzyme)
MKRAYELVAFLALFLIAAAPAAAKCEGAFAIEILGSGGPIAEGGRASSGYVVWMDGEARLLVDAGGGAFLRFAEAGAAVSSLEAILISHFHADHVADLAAILKSGFFEDRTAPLIIAGPTGNEYFPGLAAFLSANFDEKTGAYRYLSGYLTGVGAPRLEVVEIDAAKDESATLPTLGAVEVEAIPVNHGDVPALAYAVKAGGETVVFAGDQSLLSDFFDETLAGSAPALLIAHHAISEARGQPRGLHRAPSSIGEMAAGLKARRLVLSHNMKRALDARREGLAAIRKSYRGPVSIADDGDCRVIVR